MTVSWGRRLVASLVAALVVAVVTHFGNLLAFLISAQMQATNLPLLSNYFVRGTLVVFVIVFAAALLGGLRYRLVAVASGILAGVIGGLVSTTISATEQGAQIGSENIGALFATLLGVNTVFVVIAAVTTATLARSAYGRVVSFDQLSGSSERRIALVRMPASNLEEGLVTFQPRVEVDTALADKQWEAYVEALETAGWTTREVGFADSAADSVFVEDAVVLLGDVAVIARSGAESRRVEADAAEVAVADLGFTVERIMSPATLDGGDVLKIGSTIYVGRSTRTNADGVRQLRALASPLGYSVVAVPVEGALHLKSAVTALPDGSILTHPDLRVDRGLFDRAYTVAEPQGVAVVVLDHQTVLMSASAPETAEYVRELGYEVITVDISEFEKLEGTVTCLSVRVR